MGAAIFEAGLRGVSADFAALSTLPDCGIFHEWRSDTVCFWQRLLRLELEKTFAGQGAY
jgi:hypothetical protein